MNSGTILHLAHKIWPFDENSGTSVRIV